MGVARARESEGGRIPERRVTLGDTGAKPQIATTFAPGDDQLARRLTHRYCHLDRAFCRVRDRYRIIEKHHDAIARELVEARRADPDAPQREIALQAGVSRSSVRRIEGGSRRARSGRAKSTAWGMMDRPRL